ncbi:MAG: DNA-directed RNA polymerase subunit beta' [Clostridia bacterium]|nr:DNA-directed RNA polymerase subunit beta' [Clostridia bacterium]
MFELNNFDSIQIGLAPTSKIREWSYGEVTKPETINYRTLKPERDGLFCERIFGPTKDWECSCGKYKKGARYKGLKCDRCGVEVTRAKVRRERMGHIELAAPVSHIWYFKGIPSRMSLILNVSPKDLERVLYFAAFIVLDPGATEYQVKDVISDADYREIMDREISIGSFRAGMGAEAVRELLRSIDLDKEAAELREELNTTNSTQKRVKAVKRLEVVESFRKSGNSPEWMIMDVVPVIPPEIRPMVQLDGGRFASSDLNDLYRRVINRNNRLKKLLELGAPDIIVRNEKRMLQEAVDALIDNGRRGRPVTGPGNRPLKSLSDMLRGKQGRFRQNLLGKRVDYSGRSVIVVGPELKMHQCGLPKEMAIELFKPFVMKVLVEKNLAQNIRGAKRLIERGANEVWDVLEEVIKGHPVLLNRAPTLHRLGIQAFEPVLVEGRAIKLHPLVCTAFNADFDGDQMPCHVPLSVEAQAEARFLMLAANNILKPADGRPVVVPTQDMIIGSYYLTIVRDDAPMLDRTFSSPEEAILAYEMGNLPLQSMTNVRFSKTDENGNVRSKIIQTTVGKIIFNKAVPQDIGFVDRSDPEHEFDLEINFLIDKKSLNKVVYQCYSVHGEAVTAEMLDNIKAQGFQYATRGAITVGVKDAVIPKNKKEILDAADERVAKINNLAARGFYTEEERYRAVIETWKNAKDDVTVELMKGLDKFNPINMMSTSGARGNKSQITQLAGMRGLMADPSGRTIEIPVKANFREGLTIIDFFMSSHGTRKGLADTALRTADSGYLTRRLVDVCQEVIIREEDCHALPGTINTPKGVYVEAIVHEGTVIETVAERIKNRTLAEDILDDDGNVVFADGTLVDDEIAKRITDPKEKGGLGKEKVMIRSIFTCRCEHGVCAKCYGADLSNNKPVAIGEAVGIIAAQSIGEPGTQLTMRTFHTGGVAGTDITQGLPRVEEIFEARKPKGLAILSDIAGKVEVSTVRGKNSITVIASDGEEKNYPLPYNSHLAVEEGQTVEVGQELTKGSVNPHDMLRIKGVVPLQNYMLKEVQTVYKVQGVDIADKHIELIVRQMLRKVRVEDAGDTDLLPGEIVDIFKVEAVNEATRLAGGIPATSRRILLGITKAALATESFLSAASFQETTRVLTDAAIKGKVDPLLGLKESVIIGKLIPAGTGVRRYKEIDIDVIRKGAEAVDTVSEDVAPETAETEE